MWVLYVLWTLGAITSLVSLFILMGIASIFVKTIEEEKEEVPQPDKGLMDLPNSLPYDVEPKK